MAANNSSVWRNNGSGSLASMATENGWRSYGCGMAKKHQRLA
jgi:hypothetical protein